MNLPDLDSGMLVMVAAGLVVAGVVAWAALRLRRRRSSARAFRHIENAVAQFFHENAAAVDFECVRTSDRRCIVLVDASATNKRFRHSHVAELVLIDFVRQRTGLEVAHVYWRFPIKAVAVVAAADDATQVAQVNEDIDEYLREGMLRMRDLPVYDVGEASLEQFQSLAKDKALPTGAPRR